MKLILRPRILFSALTVLAGLYLVALQIYIDFSRFSFRPSDLLTQDSGKFEYYDVGVYNSIRHINRATNAMDRVLTFRLSDVAVYTQNLLAVHYDPQYLPLFDGRLTGFEIDDFLREKNIRYVYVPHYIEPAIYRTQFGELLGDPLRAELISFSQGNRVFELPGLDARANSVSRKAIYKHAFNRESIASRQWSVLSNGISRSPRKYDPSEPGVRLSLPPDNNPLFRRNVSLISGRGSRMLAGLGSINVTPASAYHLSILHRGAGRARVLLHEYSSNQQFVSSSPLWNMESDSEGSETGIQFSVGDNTHAIKLEIKVAEGDSLDLLEINIDELHEVGGRQNDRISLLREGWLVADVHSRVFSDLLDWGGSSSSPQNVYLRVHTNTAQTIYSPRFTLNQLPAAMEISLSGEGQVKIFQDVLCESDATQFRVDYSPFILRAAGDNLRLGYGFSNLDADDDDYLDLAVEEDHGFSPDQSLLFTPRNSSTADCAQEGSIIIRLGFTIGKNKLLREWVRGVPEIKLHSIRSLAASEKIELWPAQ